MMQAYKGEARLGDNFCSFIVAGVIQSTKQDKNLSIRWILVLLTLSALLTRSLVGLHLLGNSISTATVTLLSDGELNNTLAIFL
jgi:hypothetical protein